MKRHAPAMLGALLCAFALLAPNSAVAQERPRVYIDCNFCDTELLRTEMTWVDYMRDRADAQVHVLVTRQGTGGGGSQYQLEFIGLRDFAGRTDTLSYVTSVDDTPDIVRRGLVRTIKLGLVPFVAATPAGRLLDVSVRQAAPTPGAAPAADPAVPQEDPWNYWTFTVGVNGFSNGESQQSSSNFSGSISANRTTEEWKFNSSIRSSYSESNFEYQIGNETRKTVSISRSYNANALLVKSLGNHLSAGLRATASSSTFANNDLSITLAPALEYDFFPYSEITRRSLLLQYSAGVRYADYREITLYGETEETLPVHTLSLGYSTRQPWGSINIGTDVSQYLHDTQKYSLGAFSGTSLRLFRGLNFNVSGNYRRVRDQLSLPRRSLTEEQILLRQRQLATNYSYFVSLGLSYRFGSIFNNVVNPRFGGGDGGRGEVIIMM